MAATDGTSGEMDVANVTRRAARVMRAPTRGARRRDGLIGWVFMSSVTAEGLGRRDGAGRGRTSPWPTERRVTGSGTDVGPADDRARRVVAHLARPAVVHLEQPAVAGGPVDVVQRGVAVGERLRRGERARHPGVRAVRDVAGRAGSVAGRLVAEGEDRVARVLGSVRGRVSRVAGAAPGGHLGVERDEANRR